MITLEYALEYLRAPHVPCEHTDVCVARVVDALFMAQSAFERILRTLGVHGGR